MTEIQLFQAFDLHRFSPSARLQAVIDASHARTAARELSDEELDRVSAAGYVSSMRWQDIHPVKDLVFRQICRSRQLSRISARDW